MSRFLVLAAGSRGDVEPFVALAAGLRGAGHEALLASGDAFAPLAAAHDVPFAPLRIDYLELAQSDEGRAALRNPLTAGARLRSVVAPAARAMLDDAWAVARDGGPFDSLVAHPKALAGASLAERLDLPLTLALALPALAPTRAFPMPGLVHHDLGGALNRASYRLTDLALAPFRGTLAAWRREALGLPPGAGSAPVLRLHAHSPALVPPPPDWPPGCVATGAWTLPTPAGWRPPDDLAAFLAAGEAPVYVGFGSMATTDPAATTRAVVEGLRRAEVRAVVATGWGGLVADEIARTPGTLVVEGAPHAWLFPRTAAVVHHGGAGTTAAGVLAGRPAVVVPHALDQPFWAGRLHAAGVAPPPLPARRLTATALAGAMRLALDADHRRRAEALGARARTEGGVGTAVALLERGAVQR